MTMKLLSASLFSPYRVSRVTPTNTPANQRSLFGCYPISLRHLLIPLALTLVHALTVNFYFLRLRQTSFSHFTAA